MGGFEDVCETAFASGGHELDDRPVRVEGLVQGVDADLAFDALDVLCGLNAFGSVVEFSARMQARRRIRRFGSTFHGHGHILPDCLADDVVDWSARTVGQDCQMSCIFNGQLVRRPLIARSSLKP